MNDDLFELFGAVSSGFHARLQRLAVIDELGFAPFQARVVSLIARRPGCSQQTLAAWTGRDKAQIARTVKELEARQFVFRQAHQTDWRAHCLYVTPEGERAARLVNSQRADAGAEMLQNVAPEEREALQSVLLKIQATLVGSGDLSAEQAS